MRLLSFILALQFVYALPVYAFTEPESEMRLSGEENSSTSLKTSPEFAAILSGVLPSATALAILPISPIGHFAGGFTVGAGQLYAGDPQRAIIFSLAMPTALAASALIGARLEESVARGKPDILGTEGTYSTSAMAITFILVSGMSAFDAYWTARRRLVSDALQSAGPSGKLPQK